MYCKACGGQNVDGAKFCRHCGAPLEAPAKPVSAAARVPANNPPSRSSYVSDEYAPLGMWKYVGYYFLFSIPIAGLIVNIVFAVRNGKNRNLKNFSQGVLCSVILGLISNLILLLYCAFARYPFMAALMTAAPGTPNFVITIIFTILRIALCPVAIALERRDAAYDSAHTGDRPIGMWGYLGGILLYSIPIAGLIINIVLSVINVENIHFKNFTRGILCSTIIVLAFIIILAIGAFATAGIFAAAMYSY